MRLPLLFCCLIPSLLAAAAWSPLASAQARRCIGADGNPIYTDRPCAAIGAVERTSPRPAPAVATQTHRNACPRTLRGLVDEITAAFDAHDANRLAGVVHWVGASTSSAYRQMERLDVLANRPLLDIVPIYPDRPADVPEASTNIVEQTAASIPSSLSGRSPDVAAEDASPLQADAPLPARPTPRQPPIALRIEQTLTGGGAPSHTVFGLQRHMGCWWIRL